MKSSVRSVVPLLSALLVASCTGAPPGSSPEASLESPAGEPAESAPEPLLLEDDAPLLLLDESSEEGPDDGPMADNSRCHVCHMNYVEEELAVTHARAGMGCAACHGESDEHIADESWASGGNGTAPEIMYPPEAINPFCLGCHPAEKIGRERHAAVFAPEEKPAVCTDCHGEHRLAVRRCKWK